MKAKKNDDVWQEKTLTKVNEKTMKKVIFLATFADPAQCFFGNS